MADVWQWRIGVCPRDEFELVSDRLFEAGAASVEELDVPPPGMESAEPSETIRFRVWAQSKEHAAALVACAPEIPWEGGEEEARDWDLYWRGQQTPVQVGPSLWVRPPWVDFQAPAGATVLALEAKMAFGTGTHESTRLAAELLEEAAPRGRSVLDIGAGTGILSLFALRLGALRAVFTEIDPLTAPCLAENYRQNGAGAPIGILGGLEAFRQGCQFDIVVCNMIRTEVWPLRNEINRLLSVGGFLVLSGQLAAEQAPILEWFAETGLCVQGQRIAGEWWAVCARKEKG